jgi:hypothetical protein
MANCDVAVGITVTFGTSTFTFDIVDVNAFDASRDAIDCSHQGSVVAMEFTPADLLDWGELGLTGAFDQDLRPPIDQPAETITIEFPKKNPASTNGATIVGTGFLTGFSITGALNSKVEFDCTIKWSGDLTFSVEA